MWGAVSSAWHNCISIKDSCNVWSSLQEKCKTTSPSKIAIIILYEYLTRLKCTYLCSWNRYLPVSLNWLSWQEKFSLDHPYHGKTFLLLLTLHQLRNFMLVSKRFLNSPPPPSPTHPSSPTVVMGWDTNPLQVSPLTVYHLYPNVSSVIYSCMCCTGIPKLVRVQILASLIFFCNCISCVLICDDLLCMQFLSLYNNLSAS